MSVKIQGIVYPVMVGVAENLLLNAPQSKAQGESVDGRGGESRHSQMMLC